MGGFAAHGTIYDSVSEHKPAGMAGGDGLAFGALQVPAVPVADSAGIKSGGCPTVYETEHGDNLVVQGDLLTDAEALGDLKDVLPGEGAVLLSRRVVLEAARRLTS
jgi:hypothetical protein